MINRIISESDIPGHGLVIFFFEKSYIRYVCLGFIVNIGTEISVYVIACQFRIQSVAELQSIRCPAGLDPLISLRVFRRAVNNVFCSEINA